MGRSQPTRYGVSNPQNGMDVVKLADYRRKEGLSLVRMAARINERAPGSEPVSASMVDRWEQGTLPRRENMERLERASEGQVTFVDFYSHGEQPARRRSMSIDIAAARKARRRRGSDARP